MINLLNEDNFLHIFLNRVGDIVVSNLLFVLCSVPIVTIGPALTALYQVMLKIAKGDEPRPARVFFKAFRQNFRQSLILWLGLLAAALITAADIYYFHTNTSGLGRAMFLLSLGVAVLLGLLTLYVFPVTAAFVGSVKDMLRDSFAFLFMRFHYALLIAVLTTFPMIMTYTDLQMLPLSAFFWFFLGFGLIAYLNAKLFYKLFRPYLEKAEALAQAEA